MKVIREEHMHMATIEASLLPVHTIVFAIIIPAPTEGGGIHR